MRFVVVTGMSGGGKSTVMNMMEDVGFYCVDNLPIFLIEKFAEIVSQPNSELPKIALGLDVRSDHDFVEATETLVSLREKGYAFEILFLDAADEVLIKRYKETRRVHPLVVDGLVEDGIREERKVMKPIREKADYIIDTTNLLTRQLKAELDRIFVQNEEYNSLMVTVMSFGFKHGIPTDADLIFDVRFLPNPYYVDELKKKTGNDKEVQDYVCNCEEAGVFLDKLTDLIRFLIPNYVKEGKHRLVIGIGCTGGKHRSVTIANKLADALKENSNFGLNVFHRDITDKK